MTNTASENGATGETTSVTFDDIQRLLPHRYPMLMVDRVLSWRPGVSIHAVRNVTANDPILAAHFPGKPILPGALIIEGVAQSALLLDQLTASSTQPVD